VFLCNSDEDIEKEKLYIDLMLAERLAGVMISPTCEIDNPCQKRSYLIALFPRPPYLPATTS
jgi:hypothetical protein